MKLKLLWISLAALVAATTTHANEWNIRTNPTLNPDITVITRASNNIKRSYILYAMRGTKEGRFISTIQFFVETESASICQKYLNEWGKETEARINNEKMLLVENTCYGPNDNYFAFTPATEDGFAYLESAMLDEKEIQFGDAKFDMTGLRKVISEQKNLLLKRIKKFNN